MRSNRCKNYGCGRKKPDATSCATFGVGAAAECCELKRYKLRRRSCSLESINFRFRMQFRLCQLFAMIGSDFSLLHHIIVHKFSCFCFAAGHGNSHSISRTVAIAFKNFLTFFGKLSEVLRLNWSRTRRQSFNVTTPYPTVVAVNLASWNGTGKFWDDVNKMSIGTQHNTVKIKLDKLYTYSLQKGNVLTC